MVSLLALFGVSSGLRQLPAGWHKVEVSASVSAALPETAVPADVKPVAGFKLPADEKLDHFEYISGRSSFVIGISTFGPDALKGVSPDQVLSNSIHGAIHGLGAPHVKLQRDILFMGWPGVEFMLTGDETSGVCRTFLVGHTMYQLLEVYATAKGRPAGSEIFLNSLSITPAPTAGPLKKPGPLFEIFKPSSGICSVRMPGKAKLFSQPAVDGSKPAFTQYVTEYGNRIYMLGYVNFPKGKTPAEAKQNIAGQLVLAFGGTAKEAPTSVVRGGLSYDTITFTRPNGDIGRGDITTDAKHAFALIMLYPPGHAGSPDIDTFFNSFKILEPSSKSK